MTNLQVDTQQIRKLSTYLNASIEYADILLQNGNIKRFTDVMYVDIPAIIHALASCVTYTPDD